VKGVDGTGLTLLMALVAPFFIAKRAAFLAVPAAQQFLNNHRRGERLSWVEVAVVYLYRGKTDPKSVPDAT